MNPEGLPQLSGACLYSNPSLLLSLRVFLTPPSLRTPPLYFAVQNAGEEGESNLPLIAVRYPAYGARQGEDCDTKDFLSQPKKVLVTLIYVICSFFSAARRTNQEAPPQLSGFWLVATVAVGVCGTRSAQTVLALFPPSSLRLRRPIKAESGIVAFACILTPSVLLTPPSFGHLPCVLYHKTQGRCVRCIFLSLLLRFYT